MNSVMLAGNLGADPGVRFTPRGKKVANLRVAVEDRFQSSTGESSTTTDWFTVVCWGRLADVAETFAKGGRVVVAGKLKTRSWDDAGGKRRTVVEVVAFALAAEPTVRGSTAGSGSQSTPPQPSEPRERTAYAEPDYFDDDVPF
jgi:single-strand DNA-binding protein